MNKHKKFFYFLIFLVVLNCSCWGIIFERLHFKEKVAFLDVGQADSEIIISSAGNILIDAGSKNVLEELSKVLPLSDKTIDIFILSHPDKDHFLGIFEVLNHYKVKVVILEDISETQTLFLQFLKELKERKIPVILANKPLKIYWQKANKISVFSTKTLKHKSSSQDSLVALYDFHQNGFLFAGDINQDIENLLVPILTNLKTKVEVLKVNHHGSKNSSSLKFLESLKPKFAVIETGQNSYGHPNQEVLDRLKEVGAIIFRTDLDGSIIFTLDGNDLIYYSKKDKM